VTAIFALVSLLIVAYALLYDVLGIAIFAVHFALPLTEIL